MRFKTKQALKKWNELAKKEHRIDTQSGYDALKSEMIKNSMENGSRQIEMKACESKSGHTELISY